MTIKNIRVALCFLGHLTPQTEQELEAFKLAKFPPVPEKLKDPWSFKNRKPFKLDRVIQDRLIKPEERPVPSPRPKD